MMRRISFAVFALLVAIPLSAQAPAGLMMRTEGSTNPADPDDGSDVTVTTVPNGFRVATGPAVVLWNPQNTASGQYALRATFTMEEVSNHQNYYGLVFGGSELGGAGQRYGYFVISQEGNYLVKLRDGDVVEGAPRGAEAPTIQAATSHDAIVEPDANGRAVNTLEVRVGASEVQYVINGQVVHTTPKANVTASIPQGRGQQARMEQVTLPTDGIYGVRMNHQLPATVVENLTMTPGR